MMNYYEPKTFEWCGNRTIYEFIGIKLYKRFVPTTGDIARKYRNIVQIQPGKSDRVTELYRYEKQTRIYELRHLFGTIGFIALVFIINKKLSVFDIAFLSILNLCVNIYPIFLQRHNRLRIIKVLLTNDQKSPYDEHDSTPDT